MKVLLTLGCLLWERVQREVKGNRTKQQTKKVHRMLTISNHKMQNACFFSRQLTYICFYIYTGFIPQAAPRPAPHAVLSLASPPCAQPGAGSVSCGAEGAGPGEPPRGAGKARGCAPGASAKHLTENGAPRPAHACSLAAGRQPGPPQGRGSPQRPATPAEAARGRATWSPLQQQQQNQKAKIWRYSGIFFKK